MKRILLISVMLVASLLGACGAPVATPVPTATLTPTPTPKADPEREAIITFTRQALLIEAERNELMAYFASLRYKFGSYGQGFVMGGTFLTGVTASQYPGAPAPHDLAGMSALVNRLLLLDCPQSMQPIKNSLNHIYESEIQQFLLGQAKSSLNESFEAYDLRAPGYTSGMPQPSLSLGNVGIDISITKDNVNDWKQKAATERSYRYLFDRPWVQLQSFRSEVYTRWAQLLRDHGIDPVQEGLAP